MNLRERFNALTNQMSGYLEKSSKALEEGDFDAVDKWQKEATSVKQSLAAIKAQIELEEDVQTLPEPSKSAEDTTPAEEPQNTPSPAKAKDPVRLPFADADEPAEPASPMSTEKAAQSIYMSKYNDATKAVEQVMVEVHGSDYRQKQYTHHTALSKYLKGARLDAEEDRSLHQLVLTPDVIEAEVKGGMQVTSIIAAKAVQQSSALELGGVLIPEDMRMEIIKRIADTSSIRPYARVVSTLRDKVEYPTLIGGNNRYTSGARVTWVDEVPSDADGAGTQVKFGSIDIPVHTVMARIDPSRNLLEDSGMNFLAFLAEVFGESFSIDEADQFLLGDGVGRPRGILGKRVDNDYAPLDGITAVASGGATTLTADGIIDLVYDLDPQYLKNATLWARNSTYKAIRKFKSEDNEYLWQRGFTAGQPPTVLGYSALRNEGLPTVAANQYPVIFGDMSAYLIVERVGMTVERIVDSTTIGQNKVAVFGRRRVGGDVISPYALRVLKVATTV